MRNRMRNGGFKGAALRACASAYRHVGDRRRLQSNQEAVRRAVA